MNTKRESKKSETQMHDALVEAMEKAARLQIAKEELQAKVDAGFNHQHGLGGDDTHVIAQAMALIGGLFFDPYEKVDYKDGTVSTENSYGFWQDKVLSGILFQLHSGIEYSVTTTLPKAKASVQTAIRAHKGDEISETQLANAVAWVRRLTEQLAFVDDVLRQAEAQYTAITGKTYAYRSRQSANRDIVETPAMLAAKALGIGVENVAPGFGSARNTA